MNDVGKKKDYIDDSRFVLKSIKPTNLLENYCCFEQT